MRRWSAAGALFITALLLLLCSGAAIAGKESGTETLEWGDSVDIRINNTGGKDLEVRYEVRVTEGADVSIYFLDEADYQVYKDPLDSNLSYYKAHSRESVDDASYEFEWSKAGTFYLVILHPGPSEAGPSTVKYEVAWEEREASGIWDPWCWVAGMVVLVVIIFASILLRLRSPRVRSK